MNRVRAFLFGGAVLALSSVAIVSSPIAASADAEGAGKGAFGQRSRMHSMFGHEAPLISIALKHKSELNLTADQVANLETIRANYQSQTAPIQDKLRAGESEIATLMQESPANLIAVKSKIEETEKLRSELRYLRLEALENGKSVLTAQQKDQLKNLLASGHRGFRRPQPGQAS
jgi:Spy/CpxP family protein refolding chaperone